mmetsp:Transcript_4512/g.20531  ORF Transcript_4512/g.20531 Transcript_4512/m.20531 type:complete len:207 (-) Transcript_4512:1689-2309(-)
MEAPMVPNRRRRRGRRDQRGQVRCQDPVGDHPRGREERHGVHDQLPRRRRDEGLLRLPRARDTLAHGVPRRGLAIGRQGLRQGRANTRRARRDPRRTPARAHPRDEGQGRGSGDERGSRDRAPRAGSHPGARARDALPGRGTAYRRGHHPFEPPDGVRHRRRGVPRVQRGVGPIERREGVGEREHAVIRRLRRVGRVAEGTQGLVR